MRNIKLTIEYDGTDYLGWQVQNHKKQKTPASKQNRTIQETLERALAKILQERVRVMGSGRTDAGVHALGQIANLQTSSKLSCQDVQKGLNSILPEDIRLKEVRDVHLDFHARFLAQKKLYRYSIVNDCFLSPCLRRFYHLVKFPLNVKRMRQGAQYLLGKHDFRSFQAADKKERHSTRTIRRLDISKKKKLVFLDIEADGFLYRMVRNIVGTLIEVGRKRLQPQQVQQILKAKNRIYAGPCAPAKGLCLMQVIYAKQKKLPR